MTTGSHHAEHRLGSLRTGLLVLVVCLGMGYAVSRLRQGGSEAELLFARPAMGTLVEITLPDASRADQREAAALAAQAALAEVARVDSLFSRHLPPPRQTPPAARLEEQRALLELGLRVLHLSGGAFDPRVGPLLALWGFDGGEPRVPPQEALAAEVARLAALGVPSAVADLENAPDMLHFGGWAKGYAVDRALAVLASRQMATALVNAGGEIRGRGRPWRVGVQHPRLPGALVAALSPGDRAVATSGDYEQYFEQDGRRYHHLLDPRTGESARGCQSVTVLADNCALADALATAVFVLGPHEGMELIESLSGVECLIIDAGGNRHDSSGLGVYLVNE
ncbi:MAG: FAD:protein FMN transferase [Candidatus Krumholzibacteria bacterium]|nr:FAD:protein FMN transferase [Candidatus Krumholzibacteria bacterium]